MGINNNVTDLQLLHQQQMREKREAIRRRKARTHRLIVRGAIAESAIEDAESMSDEHFQQVLFNAVGKSSAPGLPQESHGSAPRESSPKGPAEQPSAEAHGSVLRKEPSADHRVGDPR